MQKLPIYLFVVCMALLAGCSPQYKILKSNQVDNFSLTQYKSFGFYEIEAKGDTLPERFTENLNLIKNAISRNLVSKGLTQSNEPDLKINLAIVVKEKIQTRRTDFRTDAPRYIGQRRYSWKSEEIETGRYREGTLLLDFVNSSQNKLVWKGGIEGILPEKQTKFEEGINKALQELIAPL
ncbi:DUF4136 domain-containing protein [Emticicia sp. BO119]|uniref:DUF4136 domain-containing protein n=1 Tax=Emticicia sp. BO119 TaxID=2757768 RepID=UPI0015F05167|nr:DUF4136 domain-containing protein [Emticicia sp. BO119]MBA4851324.1 DUF4136 domain-containing protein [Emticicia sp. BO119]